jgi:hypothetical protein
MFIFQTMSELVTNHPVALHFLMTDDLYVLKDTSSISSEVKPILPEPIVAIPLPAEVKPLTVEVKAAVKEPEVYNYLGENNKYILLLVNDATHKTLNSAHLETLLKITKAKGLELRDLAILNMHTHAGCTFEGLKKYFVCGKIVCFGLSPQTIGIPGITLNKPGKFNDVKILATFSLSEMDDNKQKKVEFWNVMKPF